MPLRELIIELLQVVVGLAAFGVVMALLLAFLDRPEDKPRPASWREALKLGLRPRVILIAAFVLIAVVARVLYGSVSWMTEELTNAAIILGVAGVVGVIFGVARTLLADYGFRVTAEGRRLRRTRGLLEVAEEWQHDPADAFTEAAPEPRPSMRLVPSDRAGRVPAPLR